MKKIPISIAPSFWFVAALLSFLLSQGTWSQIPIWVTIIFVSVLIHELGHAIAAMACSRAPSIRLVAMGGVTTYKSDNLALWKQFLITCAGPFFGFCLACTALLLHEALAAKSPSIAGVLLGLGQINLVWTVVNLLPILPLDGGQLLRIVFEKFFHAQGIRYAMLVGAILSSATSLLFFATQNLWGGVLFLFFAFDNFSQFRKTKGLRDVDQDEAARSEFIHAEEDLLHGNKAEAQVAFEKLYSRLPEGLIHDAAAQYAALLEAEQGDLEKAYQMLSPLSMEELTPEALLLLHRLTFDRRQFMQVLKLGSVAFQLMPTVEVSMRNAEAAAQTNQVEAAIGWVKAAIQRGLDGVSEVLSSTIFDPIRTHQLFIAFAAKF